jgi:exonuclease III
MTQLQDWASQFCAELEKQSSARAAQVESLLFCGDYQAIREWLEQWEAEDAEPESLRASYRQTVEKLRRLRQRQINGEASADVLGGTTALTLLPERTVTLDSGD